MSRWVIRIGVWLLLSFLTTECILVLGEPYLPVFNFQYDQEIGFRVRPYAMNSNRLGFNGPDPDEEGNGVRLVVLSDSFGWAGGRRGNYSTFLQERLDRRYGPGAVEVVNAGYPDTGPREQAVILERLCRVLSPDMVVLGLFVGNDFAESRPGLRRVMINDVVVTLPEATLKHVWGYPIVRDSRLRLMWNQNREAAAEAARVTAEGADGGMFSKSTFVDIGRDRLKVFATREREAYRGHFELAARSLDRMHRFLKRQGIAFAIAAYPDEFQVDPRLFDEIVRAYELDPADHDPDWGQQMLGDFSESRGIPFIDLLPAFREKGRREVLYLTRDTHWNEGGNRLAAEVLFEALRPQLERLNPRLIPR